MTDGKSCNYYFIIYTLSRIFRTDYNASYNLAPNDKVAGELKKHYRNWQKAILKLLAAYELKTRIVLAPILKHIYEFDKPFGKRGA